LPFLLFVQAALTDNRLHHHIAAHETSTFCFPPQVATPLQMIQSVGVSLTPLPPSSPMLWLTTFSPYAIRHLVNAEDPRRPFFFYFLISSLFILRVRQPSQPCLFQTSSSPFQTAPRNHFPPYFFPLGSSLFPCPADLVDLDFFLFFFFVFFCFFFFFVVWVFFF